MRSEDEFSPSVIWRPWTENGPELGYTAKIGWRSFPLSVEPGLEISGIGDQACSGFFPFSELQANGLSPTNIATVETLIEIKSRRP
jgi:hypothetical protein